MSNTNEIYYVDIITGEAFTDQKEAMRRYKAGSKFIVYSWSETAQKIVERARWE